MINTKKVIGYYAIVGGEEVVSTNEEACLIIGSKEKMEQIIEKREKERGKREITIRKTRFDEIMAGLSYGYGYGFDREAYERFYPLGKEAGLQLIEWIEGEEKGEFLTLRLN